MSNQILPPYNITNTSNGTSLNKTARYVFIILESVNQSLLMNEVEIYDENDTNIALNKTAVQSNTPDSNYPATKAVDGGTAGGTYSMTTWDARVENSGNGIEDENGSAHNWWGVDLGSDKTISGIRIYGHDYPPYYLENGGEWSRHAPHRIQVYTESEYSNSNKNFNNGDGPLSYGNPYLRYINDCNLSSNNNNNQQIFDYVSNAVSNEITNYSTNTGFKEAQYMFIQLETENTDMNYSEIEIYDENGTNIALNLATGSYVQSSNLDTNNTYPASLAFNNNNIEYEFHHTSNGNASGEREWLGINLGSNKKIAGIRVYGRIDSNLAYIEGGSAYARTAPFRIFLYTSDEYTGTFADGYNYGPLNYNDYSLHSDDATINKTINNQQVFYYGIVITSDTYINNRNKSIADIKYNNLPPYNITITHSITQYHEAQYFFIQLETIYKSMQYSEIEIYDENGNNVAFDASQNAIHSSQYYDENGSPLDGSYPASNAFNNINIAGDYNHTYWHQDHREWLGINLGSNKKISGIRVYGRKQADTLYIEGGGNYARIAPFRIYLYKSDEYTGTFDTSYNNGPLDYNDYSLHTNDADVNETISDSNGSQQHFLFDLSQQTKIRTPDFDRAITNYNTTDVFKEARFFFIQLETVHKAMCFSEIEIYDPSGNNIALSKDAVQSSDHGSGTYPASKAVNGIIDPYNRSANGDFQHTNQPSTGNTREWLGINLGSDKKIAGIRIYSGNYPYSVDGGDATRTEPFRIYLYTSSEYTGSFAPGYLNGPLDYDNYHLHSDDAINKRIDNLKLFYYGITPTIESGITTIGIGNYAFSSSNLISITIPDSVTTIGEYAFKDSRLTSVNIPNSVTTIGKYAFYGSSYLDDITLHKYKNDDINDNIIDLSGGSLSSKVYTTNVFSNIKRDATFTLFSDEKMDIESYIGEFRYVFYERDPTDSDREAAIAEFEVWDENNVKISSRTSANPTIKYSSRWSNPNYDYYNINNGNLTHETGEWHSKVSQQSVYDVFGNTSGTYKRAFIGYDFGFARKMSKIVLTACDDTHRNLVGGNSSERENKTRGYKLYFTNDIITVNTSDSTTYTPGSYTCVDPNGDYVVRTSYEHAIFNDDGNNETYTHNMQQFKYRYKIIDGPTSIAANEFQNRTDLLSIDITNSVTSIGNNAFQGSGLTSIDIPYSVTTIGTEAFRDCSNLDDITLHKYKNDVIDVNNIIDLSGGSLANKEYTTDVFNNIKSDATFTLFSDEKMDISPDSGTVQFKYRYQIIDGATSIAANEFQNRTDLLSIDISNSVTTIATIGNNAFDGTTNMTSCSLPINNNFTTIPDYCFRNSGLTSIIIPDSVTTINTNAFDGTTNMTSCDLPNNTSFTTIPNNCFQGSGLTSINIPNSVTSIGTEAFRNCSNLDDITLHKYKNDVIDVDNIIDLSGRSLANKEYTTDVFNNIKSNAIFTLFSDEKMDINPDSGTVQFKYRYKIIDGTTSIAVDDFQNRTDLLSIDISNSVTSIGNNAFDGTTNMTSCTLPNNTSFTTIPDYCFRNSGLISITIPDSVTTINTNAFDGTTNMTSCSLPINNNNFTTIPDYCFRNSGLISIDIPYSVTTIVNEAFRDCSSLDDITLHKYKNDEINVDNIIDLSGGSLSSKVYTTNVFSNINPDATFTLFSDEKMDIINSNIDEFQYVFYERDPTDNDRNAAIAEFEVWDENNNRISHSVNSDNILYSSRWGTGGSGIDYLPSHINNGNLTHETGEWHSKVSEQSVYDVFGNTSGSYKRAFIGYDFGGARKMSKIVLTACDKTHINLVGGNSSERARKIRGFKLYFTNDIITVTTNDDTTYTPGTYTCVDPNGDYVVRTSYDYAIFNDDGTNDTYTDLLQPFKYRYKIIDGPTSIAVDEFKDKTNLLSIDISTNSVTSIGNNAFEGTSNMTSCTLPNNDNFTTIPEYCFRKSGLTSITIPDNVTIIGNNAFEGTSNMTSCTLPNNDNFTTIGNYAFNNSGLTSIIIPNSVTTIGTKAFRNSGLTSITIPDSVTTISEGLFYLCNRLASITIGNNVTSIGLSAFSYNAITSFIIPDSVTTIGNFAFFASDRLASVTIGNSVTSIGTEAFANTALTSINIPNSVTSIGTEAFRNCSNLDDITLHKYKNDVIDVDNIIDLSGGSLANKEYTTDVFNNIKSNAIFTLFSDEKMDINPDSGTVQFKYRYQIIDGTISIAANEFKDRTDLLSIDISNSVTSIGNNAFDGTTNMTSCDLPNNTSFTTIPDYCFYYSGLTSIIIPDSVTTIGDNAFRGTTNMTSCDLPNNTSFTTIPAYCFGSSGLTSITIPDSVTIISTGAFYGTSNMTSCILPNNTSFTIIPLACFGSSGLTSITIPDSVTKINNSAFSFSKLTSITIPGNVTIIGAYAFSDCSNLRSFKLPNNPSFTTIFNSCFKNSLNWDSPQSIPHSVTTIELNAFYSDQPLNKPAYLKLPPSFKTYIPYYEGTNVSETITNISLGTFATHHGLVLVYNHLANFKNSPSHIFAMDITGTASNQLDFLSSYTINENNNNSSGLQYFRKGILKNNYDYNTTNASTLDAAYNNSPYAVAGPIGYKINGMDIGKRIAPYYTVYTSSTNNIKLIPGWTKVGFFLVGGGGGGGSGGATSGGWGWGGSGGGAGGMCIAYITKTYIDNLGINIDTIDVTVGGGGNGAAKLANNNNTYGNNGSLGGDTIIKYNSNKIVQANGGDNGEGGYGDGASARGYAHARPGTNGTSELGSNITDFDNNWGNKFIDYTNVSNIFVDSVYPNSYEHSEGIKPGRDGGYIDDYVFNFISGNYGKGGKGGQGDTTTDWGQAGDNGTGGIAIVIQYFT